MPPATFWPSRFEYVKTKWIVAVVESSFALNCPKPVVEMAGVSLSHWPVSHTSARSAVISFPCLARKPGSEGEPERNDECVRQDQKDELCGKNALGLQREAPGPSGDRAGGRVADHPAGAVRELPRQRNVPRLGAEVERRNDAAAHRDAVHPACKPDEKRRQHHGEHRGGGLRW